MGLTSEQACMGLCFSAEIFFILAFLNLGPTSWALARNLQAEISPYLDISLGKDVLRTGHHSRSISKMWYGRHRNSYVAVFSSLNWQLFQFSQDPVTALHSSSMWSIEKHISEHFFLTSNLKYYTALLVQFHFRRINPTELNETFFWTDIHSIDLLLLRTTSVTLFQCKRVLRMI